MIILTLKSSDFKDEINRRSSWISLYERYIKTFSYRSCELFWVGTVLYLWQATPQWCSSYKGGHGSTLQFGHGKVGSCRSMCSAHRSWNIPSGTLGNQRWLSERRNTGDPYSDFPLHMSCPHTHTHAPLFSGALLPPLQKIHDKDDMIKCIL